MRWFRAHKDDAVEPKRKTSIALDDTGECLQIYVICFACYGRRGWGGGKEHQEKTGSPASAGGPDWYVTSPHILL